MDSLIKYFLIVLGENSNVEHNLINLATEDVSNVKEAFWNLQYIWALPIKMAVIVVLIYQKIGITLYCQPLQICAPLRITLSLLQVRTKYRTISRQFL